MQYHKRNLQERRGAGGIDAGWRWRDIVFDRRAPAMNRGSVITAVGTARLASPNARDREGGGALDKVREAVAAGLPAFGTWVTIGDPLSGEAIGKAGYDC